MTFPSQVRQFLTAGNVGEVSADGPIRSTSWNLLGQAALLPTIGRVFTYFADGVAQMGNPGDLGVFAGVFMGPKEQALRGTSAGTLEGTLEVPVNSVGELLTMGIIFVELEVVGVPANYGDPVNYRVLDGSFTTAAVAVGIVATGGRLITDDLTVSSGQLAVIEFTSPQ